MTHRSAPPQLTRQVEDTLLASFDGAEDQPSPFRHWVLRQVFPTSLAHELRTLPWTPPELGGVSGKRELHNDQRHYFAGPANARFPACAAVAQAFQSARVVAKIEAATGADLGGSYVRLEYAQDTDGFWLEPHTDLGVKRFTMLIYLAQGDGDEDLGTDLFHGPGRWAKRSSFDDNSALVFVPADNTWHGLARRAIPGVRRSVIMNYVTDEWRARDQLAFPETPVRS
ncbi:MAG TPA: hypothetical protein VG248_12530 [Caulobacteraceae bacterium]|nr:hypothetical protein [Caulobacteraceae bacterium]